MFTVTKARRPQIPAIRAGIPHLPTRLGFRATLRWQSEPRPGRQPEPGELGLRPRAVGWARVLPAEGDPDVDVVLAGPAAVELAHEVVRHAFEAPARLQDDLEGRCTG